MIPQLGEAWSRIQLGWRRTFPPKRRPSTLGHYAQAQETETSLRLMAQAAAAGADMSDEQAIFLSSSKPGMRARVTVLLGIPNRSLAEERELTMIERELARLEGREEAPVLVRRESAPAMGFLGPLAAVSSFRLWHALAAGIVLTGAATAVQTARLNNAKHDLQETRENLALAAEQRQAWKERAEAYASAVADARETALQTAEALDAERRRRATAAAAERRRQREIQNVLTNSSDPPAWSLRDDSEIPIGPGPSD